MSKPRYFWLKSDGKTVKEITAEEYDKLRTANVRSATPKYLLCILWTSDILFLKERSIDISFSGITAVESRHRMFVACKKGMEYYSFKDGLYKVHPIMFWTEQEVWEFTKDNDIPINEAYGKYGINRIGCMWCMSHRGWRNQVSRINPRVYCYMMRRYFGTPSLLENLGEVS